MIKEVNDTSANLAYYCDFCGKKILFPGTALAPGVSYCISGDTNNYNTLLTDMRYFHICSDCITEKVKPVLEELGIKAYKSSENMSKEEFNEALGKNKEEE